ncbi:PAC2 family protein [Candidatus Bathyarchaeota archaeon]|nr:PAC2 family protein [Candidatus Bathyarchaeota archaeon]
MSGLTAIVGSRGLRSVGKIAVDYLVEKLQPRLIEELYSPHFPMIYQTQPSYAAHPDYPGRPGVWLQHDRITLPKVEFHLSDSPRLLLTRGYHANFQGQHEVAEQVLDIYEKHSVTRLFVLAGYGVGEGEVCCAATDPELVDELKKHGIGTGYEGPFIGFSGLVLGLAKLRGIKGICLFGRSQPNPEDPESPDPQAARRVLEKLAGILELDLDLTGLEKTKAGQTGPTVVGS